MIIIRIHCFWMEAGDIRRQMISSRILLLRVLMYMVRAEQEHLSGKQVLLLQQRIVPGVRH